MFTCFSLPVLGQHGVIGDIHSDVDLSYLSDATIFFLFFEASGRMPTAVCVLKSRTSDHDRTLHEFRLASGEGIQIGASAATDAA